MTIKDLGPLSRFLNVNVILVVFLAVAAWVLARQFVTLEKHEADVAPLRDMPHRAEALQAQIMVLEDFRLEQKTQSDQIARALGGIAVQIAEQNQKADAAVQRLKRIEDKIDRQ